MTTEHTTPTATGPRFDPTDRADLEQLAAHLHQRSGLTFTIPAPFEWPQDAGDPNSGWQVYPEDPAVRHYDRVTKSVVDIAFPEGSTFRVFGWLREGSPPACRVIDRAGRFFNCGPAELADGLAALLTKMLTGDP